MIRQIPLDLLEPGRFALRDCRACIASTSRALAPETTVLCVGADGQHLWTQKLAGALTSLELDSDTLYVAAGGGVRALDADPEKRAGSSAGIASRLRAWTMACMSCSAPTERGRQSSPGA